MNSRLSRLMLALSALMVLVGVVGAILYNYWVFESPGSTPFFLYQASAVLEFFGWIGVVSHVASRRKKWTPLRVLKAALLVSSLTLLGLGAADMLTVWTIGFNPAVQMEVSSSVVVEGVDFRLLVTELTFGTLAAALSLLVDMLEKGLLG